MTWVGQIEGCNHTLFIHPWCHEHGIMDVLGIWTKQNQLLVKIESYFPHTNALKAALPTHSFETLKVTLEEMIAFGGKLNF